MTGIEEQTASTVAIVARFTAVLERRDVDALLAEMTDDIVLESASSIRPYDCSKPS